MGQEVVHLKRTNSDGTGVTGLIECNVRRNHSMDFDQLKIKTVRYLIDESANSKPTSCIIM
jgi:hypothetical protein